MSYSKLMNPKKKRRVFATKDSPFPVPIASITGEQPSENQWLYYTGNLLGNQVIVRHSGDMNFMYKMGFFGKGSLSRSKPEFNQRCKVVTIPVSQAETNTCRVIPRRSYIRRLKWQNSKSGDLELDEYDSSQEVEFWDDETSYVEETPDNVVQSELPLNLKEKDEGEKNARETNQSVGGDDWSAAIELWDNAEADEDFWGMEPSGKTDKRPSSTSIGTMSVKKQRMDELECSRADDNFIRKESAFPNSSTSKNLDSFLYSQSENIPPEEQHQNSDNVEQIKGEHSKSLPNVENHTGEIDNEKSKQNEFLTETIFEATDTLQKSVCMHTDLASVIPHEKEKMQKHVTDPLCMSEEEHGNLFVMEDSDYQSENRKRKWGEPTWRPVVKEDPYFVREFLCLTLEESFFLAYGLGCLRVYEKGQLLNLTEMWRIFCQRHDRFISLYAVYHYFRSKGWVPKSGLKFGTDFIVYKEGPPFYHGSYSVLVKMVNGDGLTEEEYCRSLTWTQLAGLNRLTEHVAKELMICYVFKPKTISESDMMKSPRVINQFRIKEMIVARWISSQERESKCSEEIP